MKGRSLTLAAAFTLAIIVAVPVRAAPVSSDLLSSLPEGLVKDVLGRMPAAQREALQAVARAEISRISSRSTRTDASSPAVVGERLLGARIALLVAANTFKLSGNALAAWQVSSSDQLRKIAFASEIMKTDQGRSLLETAEGARVMRQLLLASPYVYRPTNPCSEVSTQDFDRLDICVDRKTFKSTVGLAWKDAADRLVVKCTGQLISKTIVLTADHCFDNNLNDPVVLTHFTGGSDHALLADGRKVLNVRQHKVLKVYNEGPSVNLGNGLRGFDVALVTLSEAVPFEGFPTLSSQLPSPVTFTVAGWGPSDVKAVNAIGLEVTVISPQGDLHFIDPSLRSWPANPTAGGGICHADSGGPIFGGAPASAGATQMRLVSIVAGGNRDCRSGDQVMTDLTRAETVSYICRLTAGVPNCPRH